MTRPFWYHQGLEDFSERDEPLGYALPPALPGQDADPDALHELFHEQTKYHRATARGIARNIRAHNEQPGLTRRRVAGRHRRAGLVAAALPQPAPLEAGLSAALNKRRSVAREALRGTLGLQCLSNLLHHAVAANRTGQPVAAPELIQHFRPYPSAGALYPCELHLVVRDVPGLAPGVYRYDAVAHDLVLKPASEGADFAASEILPGDAGPVPCAIAVTAVFDRAVHKYGVRGYRLALIEAGHILQNLSLIAAALEVPSLVSASFYEAELEAILQIDGVSEAVLASFLLGEAAGDA